MGSSSKTSLMNSKLVLSTLTLSLLASCGGASRTPLTDEQKLIVGGVVAESSTSVQASSNVASTKRGPGLDEDSEEFRPVLPPDQIRRTSELRRNLLSITPFSADVNNPLTDKQPSVWRNLEIFASNANGPQSSESATDKPIRLMEDSMAECEATFPEAPNMVESTDSASGSILFSLDGEACPVAMDFAFYMGVIRKLTGYAFSFNFETDFAIVDPAFEKYTELRSMDFDFGMNADIEVDEQKQTFNADGEFTGGGHIETAEVGRVPLTMSGTFRAENEVVDMNMVLTMEFTDFTAIFELVQNGKDPAVLYLNGEEVDEDYMPEIPQNP